MSYSSAPSGGADWDFESHGITYKFCRGCGHLNGGYSDTEEFFMKLYLQENGFEHNSSAYVDEAFDARVREIYSPKVQFLQDSIPSEGFSILDIGCGAGHFVAACLAVGINATGIDVSKTSIDFGNQNLSRRFGKRALSYVNNHDYIDKILESKSTVISAIGVIEHIQDLPRLFDAIRGSKAEYVYYSVPMASLSVLIENIMPNLFPRQLSADHTHLFTEKSLTKLNQLMRITPIAEWRFGSDITDLLRSLSLTVQESGMTQNAHDFFLNPLNLMRDELQTTLDKSHFCSEIHVLGRKEL
jgi:SAM-dependent methyltransferase